MLTQEQIEQIVADAKTELTRAVVEQVKKDVQYNVQRVVYAEIEGIVRTYVKENVAPEVTKALAEERTFLIESAVTACKDVSTLLAKAMAERITSKLSVSYERKKILDALLG